MNQNEPSTQRMSSQQFNTAEIPGTQQPVYRQHSSGYVPQHAQPSQQQPLYEQPYEQPYEQQPQYGQQRAQQPKQPEKKGGGLKTFFIAFAGAALACVLVLAGANMLGFAGGKTTTTLGGSGAQINVTEDSTLAGAVAQKALPSVVSVDVYTKQSSTSGYMGVMGGQNQSDSNELTQSSLGSGVVLSADGYILTNYHVIEGADALSVTIEGVTYEASIVGTDATSDLAVIKAKDASGLTAIELGDSDTINQGDWVMSIGSPFGLEQSIATGIVSATSRSQIMEGTTGNSAMLYTNLIQTDAAINPGNSGGALVDDQGKLIGINTLITSYSGNYSGVGFAIPVNYAINIAQQIIEGKTPTHAQLGVTMATITPAVAKNYNLSASEGAYVTGIVPDTGAAQAGLQEGDIITAFDGKKIASASDLMLAVRSKNPGDTATLTVNRKGQVMDLSVTLGSDESTAEAAKIQQNSQSQNGQQGNSGNSGGNGGYEYYYRR